MKTRNLQAVESPPSSEIRVKPVGSREGGGSAASSYGRAFRNNWQSYSYSQKLTFPEWQEFSHRIKVEANWHCEECGDRQGPGVRLEVHHVHYETGRLPWEYPRALVMALCPSCHHERQLIEQRIMSNIAELLRQKSIPEMLDQPIYAIFTPTDYEV
jgi:hypothetical protein